MKKILTAVLCLLSIVSVSAAKKPKTVENVPAVFNLATYNIRMPSKDDVVKGDGWARRLPHVTGLIKFHDFNIFGTQEGMKFQLDSMKAQLPGYDYIGVAREDGKEKGEHSAIFYDTNLFDVLEHGDFWLSETPDRPSLGWDAACIRICTWGHFRHKPSGKEFVYFNLHMDHVGVKARQESVELVKKKIKDFGLENIPAFLTGDFNLSEKSDLIKSIIASGAFNDSYEIAEICYKPNGTFNNFRPDGYTEDRIDHIFVSPGVEVKRWGVLTDTYHTLPSCQKEADFSDVYFTNVASYDTRTPSDHYPIKVQLVLK